MSDLFKSDSVGTGVVEMFPARVKHKTFLLAGLVRGDLAATTADALAHGGAGAIIFTGYSQPELQPVIDHINRKHPKVKIIFITADTGSLASIQEAAAIVKKLTVPIDGIIGFPTVMAAPWETTADGIESQFQRNYLCHFLLVNLLLPTMSPESRVVLITTSIRREALAPNWEDVDKTSESEEAYHPLDGYAQSMFANILFVKLLARVGADRSIAAFSANPGNTKTNVQTHVSPEEVSSWLQRKKEGMFETLPSIYPRDYKPGSDGASHSKLARICPSSCSKHPNPWRRAVRPFFVDCWTRYSKVRGLRDQHIHKTYRHSSDQSGAFLDNCQVLSLPHLDFPEGEDSAKVLWTCSEELVRAYLEA
ncbi:hypothetical protein NUU61_000304 [Penicillium alfredii]|uniref:Uncharacterized protein n=1 Tax=Penicillium alfredii TaxID=1506179 RepID=A0A9W9GAQ8_9EURO|nr:uncharacterized protein NUU61_000304 [Penicillium alfredii]KAJ5114545.1 hypothetical protein NUU61_000304 [Penicillium alfredii]